MQKINHGKCLLFPLLYGDLTGLCNAQCETAAEIKTQYCSVVECAGSIVDIFVADEKKNPNQSSLSLLRFALSVRVCVWGCLFLYIKGSGSNPDPQHLFLLGRCSGKTFH